MMKSLLLTLFIAIPMFVGAQTKGTQTNANNAQSKTVYALFSFSGRTVEIDYGNSRKIKSLEDENGNKIEFYTLVGALNYLSLQGWTLVGDKTSVSGNFANGVGSTSSNTTFIICKQVTEEELRELVDDSIKSNKN